MINVPSSAKKIASRYFWDNVGDAYPLARALGEFIEVSDRKVLSSRKFGKLEDLERGSYSNTLVPDLVASLKTCEADAAGFIFDIWMDADDAKFKTKVVVEERFSPALVYSLGAIGGDDLETRVSTVLRYGGFNVVVFATTSSSWKDFQAGRTSMVSPSAVMITAFDQEGCVAWR